MKKILFLFLLIPSICFSSMYGVSLSGVNYGSTGGGGGSDCDWSTADIAWDGEHTSGNTYWCKEDDSSVNGTLNGASIVTDPGTLTGTYLLIDADTDRFTVATTSSEFDMTQGYIHLKMSVPNCTGTTYFFTASEVGGDYIYAYIDSSEYISLRYYNSNLVSMTGTDAVPSSGETINETTYGTVTDVYLAWDTAGNLHSQGAGVELGVCVGASCGTPGAGSWEYEVDADDAVDTTDPTEINIGYNNASSHANDIYITDIEIYTTSSP